MGRGTVAGVLILASMLPPGPGGPRTAAAYALVVAHSLPIAVRRRFPLPVLAWALATGLAFASLGFNLVPLGLSILIYIRYATDAVDIEVVDDGRGGRLRERSDGHGIVGMRERAVLYGGWLDAGPLPGGGFRVAAHLPVDPGGPAA
jgi:hypothetical protein